MRIAKHSEFARFYEKGEVKLTNKNNKQKRETYKLWWYDLMPMQFSSFFLNLCILKYTDETLIQVPL